MRIVVYLLLDNFSRSPSPLYCKVADWSGSMYTDKRSTSESHTHTHTHTHVGVSS